MCLVSRVPMGPAVVQITVGSLKLCLSLTDMVAFGLYGMRLLVNYLMYFVLLRTVCSKITL
jgi:hypothetical protein